METFNEPLKHVRFNAQLRQLAKAIGQHKETYELAGHFANDHSTDGRNWRELQISAFMQMQAAGDRIMELVTEFFNNKGVKS
jgi:hypothetical protein